MLALDLQRILGLRYQIPLDRKYTFLTRFYYHAFILPSVNLGTERFIEPQVANVIKFLKRRLHLQPIPIDKSKIVRGIDCEVTHTK